MDTVAIFFQIFTGFDESINVKPARRGGGWSCEACDFSEDFFWSKSPW